MGDDAAVQKALSDPKFLALGPDDQVAVLKTLGGQPPAKPSAAATATPNAESPPAGSLPPPPKTAPSVVQAGRFRSPAVASGSIDIGDAATKLGRGAALGAASGAGIPETQTPVADLAKSILDEAWATPGRIAGEAQKYGVEGVVGAEAMRAAKGIAGGLYGAGKEAWQGLRDSDPETFAHGLGSAVTQALMLRSMRKMGETAPPTKIKGQAAMANVTKAIDAGGEQVADLKTAMPDIIKIAKQTGLENLGEFGDAISKAHGQVEQQFNQALAPVANDVYVPAEIARRVRGLITPDMAKTAEGRMAAKEIEAAARDYDKPWTIREINAKRMTENDNLRSFYSKDTRGQAASKLQTDISQAVADGGRDIVYDKITRANPGLDARQLKLRQGALWALDDYVNHPKRGVIADLTADQLQHQGEGLLERFTVGASIGRTGVPHGYIGGFARALGQGPMVKANARIQSVFGAKPTPAASRAMLAALGLPLAELNRSKQRQGSLPPPPTADEDGE